MRANVTMRCGPEPGRRYVLRPGQRFVVGRGRDVSIHVDDPVISRRHAVLELLPDGLRVTDLGSRNGTFLDGKQLAPNEARMACPEDVLQVGDNVFDVELVGLDDRTRGELDRTRRFMKPLLSREEFEVLGEVGRGATGVVYAVHQRLLLRNVAVKVPHADLLDDPKGRRRFLREGQLCCRVESPYVVQVHDVRTVGEQVYLIMELVNGISAKDRVFSGPVPTGEALRIGEHIAYALDAAHSVGVVHRDLKPSNVLITPEGRAKLSDFGIAKWLDAEEREGEEALTPSGEGLGTLAYVSPEQARDARRASPLSDIYGLGSTLYHLIAGHPMLVPRTASELLGFFDRPLPSLVRDRPTCPGPVADFVQQMVSRDPRDRPQTAAEVASNLRALRRGYFAHVSDRVLELGETDIHQR